LGFENAMGKAHFFNEIEQVIIVKCYVCFRIEKKDKVWWLNGIPLKSM
jgi:hypothetical protein